MSSNVEKGTLISVLVEQAFPTCILVSFQHERKTFRGVLLDESSQTVIRATPEDVLGKADNTANLGLTTARATTCQSSQDNALLSRICTRSSTMLRDGKAGNLGRITPVHKIRGLVESLNQRPKKLASTIQPSISSKPMKSQTEKLTQSCSTQSLAQYQSKGNLTNYSVKRKRDGKSIESNSYESSCKSAKGGNQEDTNAGCPLSGNKPKQEVLLRHGVSSLPLQSAGSPLFPVLKLKRTCGNSNSYAVTVLNSCKGELKEACVTDKSDAPINETNAKPSGAMKDAVVHRHNTRYKARKGTENCQISLGSENDLDKTNHLAFHQNGDSSMKINSKETADVSADINAVIRLNGNDNTDTKHYKNLLQKSSKLRRQLKPKKIFHSQNMKVGDIVWGKVHGHPWWPGRVLGILCNASEGNAGYQIVKVSWYGSTTTSDISCSSLLTFQEHFKHLFKKQKKGAYRLAVRQAQKDLEACNNGTQVMPA